MKLLRQERSRIYAELSYLTEANKAVLETKRQLPFSVTPTTLSERVYSQEKNEVQLRSPFDVSTSVDTSDDEDLPDEDDCRQNPAFNEIIRTVYEMERELRVLAMEKEASDFALKVLEEKDATKENTAKEEIQREKITNIPALEQSNSSDAVEYVNRTQEEVAALTESLCESHRKVEDLFTKILSPCSPSSPPSVANEEAAIEESLEPADNLSEKGSALNVTAVMDTDGLSSDEEARGLNIFRVLDTDQSGGINIVELGQLLDGDDRGNMLAVLDQNADGIVSSSEWLLYLKSQKKEKGDRWFASFLDFVERKFGIQDSEKKRAAKPESLKAKKKRELVELKKAQRETQSRGRSGSLTASKSP